MTMSMRLAQTYECTTCRREPMDGRHTPDTAIPMSEGKVNVAVCIELGICPSCHYAGLTDAEQPKVAVRWNRRILREARDRYTTPLVFSAPGTADSVLAGTKTVTRRLITNPLKPGCRWREGAHARIYRLTPRAKGKPIGEVQIVGVRQEMLDAITLADVKAEGFPHFTVQDFLSLFRLLHPRHAHEWRVHRIEFKLTGASHVG
jgi:hypothetical protein